MTTKWKDVEARLFTPKQIKASKARAQREAKKLKATRYRVYFCGTIPAELDPSNTGGMEFYMSAGACSDSRDCTDECGIIEGTLTIGDVVQEPGSLQGATAKDVEKRRRVEEALGARMLSAVKDAPAEAVRGAIDRLRAGYAVERVRARRRIRLKAKRKT